MESADLGERLRAQVAEARRSRVPLRIRGGGTRAFLCGEVAPDAVVLDLSSHRGILEHVPSELTLTARAGTPLLEVERVLAEAGQMLAFDPPRFARTSTLGGAVATGLSGPARPWRGAVRDAVLGVRLLDGHGEIGRYGGEVMKNVAGYDVSRLVTGSHGSLGVLLDVSLRVMPRPAAVRTQLLPCGLQDGPARMLDLGRRPLPLAGLAWQGGSLRVRLAGSEEAVAEAARTVGGDPLEDEAAFWSGLRDLALPFFEDPAPLWRLSVPVDAPQPALAANWFLDWGGAQRWCVTEDAPERVLEAARALGGHALRYRPSPLRTALAPGLRLLHARVREAFDPAGLFTAAPWES